LQPESPIIWHQWAPKISDQLTNSRN
jgi:hypothetical protein